MDLVLAATLLLVVFPSGGRLHLVVGGLALLGLVVPAARNASSFWALMTAIRVADHLSVGWFVVDNHHFLLTYWCLALGLALGVANPLPHLRTSARLLLGLSFAFAAVWKLLGGEYVDGSFLTFLFVTDPLYTDALPWVTVPSDAIVRNTQALAEGSATFPSPADVVLVGNSPTVERWSVLFGRWTIGIEFLIAATFLTPLPRPWSRVGHVALLAFVATTYLIAPVLVFGLLLLVLGAAQLDAEETGWRTTYHLAFILLTAATYAVVREPFKGLVLTGAILVYGYLVYRRRWLLLSGLVTVSLGLGPLSGVMGASLAAAVFGLGLAIVLLALLDRLQRRPTEPPVLATGAAALLLAVALDQFDHTVTAIGAMAGCLALGVAAYAQRGARPSSGPNDTSA